VRAGSPVRRLLTRHGCLIGRPVRSPVPRCGSYRGGSGFNGVLWQRWLPGSTAEAGSTALLGRDGRLGSLGSAARTGTGYPCPPSRARRFEPALAHRRQTLRLTAYPGAGFHYASGGSDHGSGASPAPGAIQCHTGTASAWRRRGTGRHPPAQESRRGHDRAGWTRFPRARTPPLGKSRNASARAMVSCGRRPRGARR
jgi:hypothetical protein